jgi:hypothetical protein
MSASVTGKQIAAGRVLAGVSPRNARPARGSF